MHDLLEAVHKLRLPPTLETLFERTGRLTISARVAVQALLTPNAPAVIELDPFGETTATLSWSAFDDAVVRAARGYHVMGVGLHSRVAIALASSVEHLVAAHAAWRVGAVPAPIDHRLPPTASDAQLKQIMPDLTISDDPKVGYALSTVSMVARTTRQLEWTLPAVWAILPTGGTTAAPRLTEQPGALWGRFDQAPPDLSRNYGLAVDQTQLVVLPMFHGFGFGYTHAFGLALGHRIVLPTKPTAEILLSCVERHSVEFLALVPTQMRRAAHHPDFRVRDLSSLQAVVHGGEACAAATKRAWMARIGPTRIYEAYGASDISLACTVRGDEWLLRPGTVGRPSGSELRIVDDEGAELPEGSVGRIVCRPTIVGARHPTFIGEGGSSHGFRETGDRGWVDRDGFLYVVGRADNAITMGGVTIVPEHVEETIQRHPSVIEVVVVGLPDPDLGESLHVVAQTREGLDNGTLLRWCRERLPPDNCPRGVTVLGELPATSTGKLDRRQAWRLAESDVDET